MDETGYIYYMRVGELIKIGYSTNPKDRLRQYPPGSELLTIEPGTLELEHERITSFPASLAWGNEWFNETREIKSHIAKVWKKNGSGTVHAPGWRQKSPDAPAATPPRMTIIEAAEHMQVSTKTIRRWISAGLVKADRVGPRVIRIDRDSLIGMGRPLQYIE